MKKIFIAVIMTVIATMAGCGSGTEAGTTSDDPIIGVPTKVTIDEAKPSYSATASTSKAPRRTAPLEAGDVETYPRIVFIWQADKGYVLKPLTTKAFALTESGEYDLYWDAFWDEHHPLIDKYIVTQAIPALFLAMAISSETDTWYDFDFNGLNVGLLNSCDYLPDSKFYFTLTARYYTSAEEYTDSSINTYVTEKEMVEMSIAQGGTYCNYGKTEITGPSCVIHMPVESSERMYIHVKTVEE